MDIEEYVFSYEGFEYARMYFEMNGVKGGLAGLTYRRSDSESIRLMEPLLKVGIIQTKRADGFEERKPQIAIKVSQPKITTTRRNVRGRVKGVIRENIGARNFVIVLGESFAATLRKVCNAWDNRTAAREGADST